MKAALKRVGRVLLWPLRRFFDPRFQGCLLYTSDAADE